MKTLLFLSALTLFALPAYAKTFQEQTESISNAVVKDLTGSYFDVKTTPKKAAAWNEKVVSSLEHDNVTGPVRGGRQGSLTEGEIQALYKKISTDPVADYTKVKKYDPDGHIGFCFGRAMNVHLTALRPPFNLAKENIRKIWAVGTMKYNKIY